jgi:hypothetical protein
MLWLWVILGVIGGLAVGLAAGFFRGINYTTRKLLPVILAKMDVRELASVANEASKLREVDQL